MQKYHKCMQLHEFLHVQCINMDHLYLQMLTNILRNNWYYFRWNGLYYCGIQSDQQNGAYSQQRVIYLIYSCHMHLMFTQHAIEGHSKIKIILFSIPNVIYLVFQNNDSDSDSDDIRSLYCCQYAVSIHNIRTDNCQETL